MTPDQNNNAENAENLELSPPTRPESPSHSHGDMSQWIMQGLNLINGTLNEIRKDISDLKDRVARLEEKAESIPRVESGLQSLEKRVRKLENRFWVAVGIVAVIVFLARIFLPDFDITITLKP